MVNRNIIKNIVNTIEKYEPEKIILFGSYAYGNPSENSDIDLFVIKENNKNLRDLKFKIKRDLLDYICNENVELDLFIDNNENINYRLSIGDLFYNEILTKGKVLYAK
jgi:uncharacterized protein